MAIYVGTIAIMTKSAERALFERTRIHSAKQIIKYDTMIKNAFSEMDKQAEEMNKVVMKQPANLIKTKPLVIKRKFVVSKKVTPIVGEHIVDKIVINHNDKTENVIVEQHKWPQFTQKQVHKGKDKNNKRICSTHAINNLIAFVTNLCLKHGKQLQVGEKRLNSFTRTTFQRRRVVRIQTAHHQGKRKQIDVSLDKFTDEYIIQYLSKRAIQCPEPRDVKHGDSGLLVFTNTQGWPHKKFDFIRGLKDDQIVLCRTKLKSTSLHGITHFSSNSQARDEFWNGMNIGFQKYAERGHAGECSRDLPVKIVGELTGLVLQKLIKAKMTTCSRCIENFLSMNDTELREHLHSDGITNAIREVADTRATCILRSLETINKPIRFVAHPCVASEVIKLTAGINESPMRNMKHLVEYVSKGNTVKQEEVDEAMKVLLEVVRWFRNRTDNIKAGSPKTFRNKLSAKSHLNLALMNDKMMTEDGQFDWKSKAYHCKRFYKDYFNEIKPGTDYTTLMERKHIRGSRLLAIRNLIVTTDSERMMKGMVAHAIQRYECDTYCIAREYGNTVYPCSCVTLDDGSPVFSRFFMPTKHHLVIGNTGDPKYVNVPGDGEKLLIVKDGYCYLHIFLSMFMHLPEQHAKEYTKMIRDAVIPALGKWPTVQNLAALCVYVCAFYPTLAQAELPIILVDHEHKTMHVMDSYGSASVHYHILKAATVEQLMRFASVEMGGEIKNYNVGGELDEEFFDTLPEPPNYVPTGRGQLGIIIEQTEETLFKRLVKASFSKKQFHELLTIEPMLACYSILSVKTFIRMHKNGCFESAIMHFVNANQPLATIFSTLELLGKRVSVANLLRRQIQILNTGAFQLQNLLMDVRSPSSAYHKFVEIVNLTVSREETNMKLNSEGWIDTSYYMAEKKEQYYNRVEAQIWADLTYYSKCQYALWSTHFYARGVLAKRKSENKSLSKTIECCVKESFSAIKQTFQATTSAFFGKCKLATTKVVRGAKRVILHGVNKYLLDIFKLMNVLIVLTMLLEIYTFLNKIRQDRVRYQLLLQKQKQQELEQRAFVAYKALEAELGDMPTYDQYVQYLDGNDKELAQWMSLTPVEQQADKNKMHAKLEQIIAISALIMMVFDAERSDALVRTLQKCKTIFTSATQSVRAQSLDDINDIVFDKKLTVDIELNCADSLNYVQTSETFEKFWDKQIRNGRTVAHYRVGGEFIEFTRSNCVQVCNSISNSAQATRFLVRGAVGSGKSTGLPFHLSSKGKVLLLEPTRPLTENVHQQLSSTPFNASPTMRMRGKSIFGVSPISVMTTGFAFQLLAHNREQINDYDFIIFDECHVIDEHAMALYALLSDHKYTGKILAVSATPPGREDEFKTQYPVTVNTESKISFAEFVQHQGTGSNACVTSRGDNILVYVASYNEVDMLSALLLKAGFKVMKVDGRTMKSGPVNIVTQGQPGSPHFIVATNIIENGVTLDIDVVVDFGTKVVPILDADNRMVRYSKANISYGERIQRMGRVGRKKNGHVLRIGHTEKGLVDIPQLSATGAALLCFAHGLPIITGNVVVSSIANSTIEQVRTSMNFELPYLYTLELISSSGAMHPEIHRLLKEYKLRDSETLLVKEAIPYGACSRWLKASQYETLTGQQLNVKSETRIPFLVNGIPENLHEKIAEVCTQFSVDHFRKRITVEHCHKVAHTLRTDLCALPRTLAIIEELLVEERRKAALFQATTEAPINFSSFNLGSICGRIKQRYMCDYSKENLRKLEEARSQIHEYAKLSLDEITIETLAEFQGLTLVTQQSKDGVIDELQLRGKYKYKTILQDTILSLAVFAGGSSMLYAWFKESMEQPVTQQGKANRNKLKFKQARFNKELISAFGTDEVIESNFGAAYKKKGKQKGSTKGMGTKQRRFVSFYGFDVDEYDELRFMDPITGITYDRPIYSVDALEIEQSISDDRQQLLESEQFEPEAFRTENKIKAYFVSTKRGKALEVDLTRHEPLAISSRTHNVMGYPEREGEFRQTGQAKEVPVSQVPQIKELEAVMQESKSVVRGLKDYNPIGEIICSLTITNEIGKTSVFGLGYGPYIITTAHLFERVGKLKVVSRHGVFECKDSQQILKRQVPERDMIVIKMPKDYPILPKRLHFRTPVKKERIVMIGAQYQTNRVITTISGESTTFESKGSHFWKHWISTKDGQCGLPMVSTRDSCVVGIHCLSADASEENFYTSFPENFKHEFLDTSDDDYTSHWSYNYESITWGSLYIPKYKPQEPFKVQKEIMGLFQEVFCQATDIQHNTWLTGEIHGNLQLVGTCPGNLITKHVIRGKCPHFATYLHENEQAAEYFEPLLGHYNKSNLNQKAFVKDFLKYVRPIPIGEVDFQLFEQGFQNTCKILENAGMQQCQYVTDTETIFNSLNMKAAVGAVYGGKKADYFEGFSLEEKENHLIASCERLYKAQMGIWNGSLKAELRTVEKVRENKTRVFTAAPLDTLLGGKVCVDDFNNQFYTHNCKGPWTVGITKFYRGWHEFLNLLPKGWVLCDADGSQFDSSLTPFLINAVLNIRLKFNEQWDIGERMLRNYYTEIIYTPVATPDGSIIKKCKGNNSGQPSTVVDNTLMVILTMQYTLLKCGVAFEEQHEIIRYFANGDDLVIAIEPTHQEILESFSKCFAELGLSYNFSSRPKDIKEVSYMSHQAIEREGTLIPKLDKERIVAILEFERSDKPVDRMNAIVAAMIEAWGYDDLMHEIRKFYYWLATQYPFSELALTGNVPYLAETALRKLYLDIDAEVEELEKYQVSNYFEEIELFPTCVRFQSGDSSSKPSSVMTARDKDVDAGTPGTFSIPKPKSTMQKMQLPTIRGKTIINVEHLMKYTPRQVDLYNTRATQKQFEEWYNKIRVELDLSEEEMGIVLNGFMVWCIENSTSPDINGMWTMMDGDQQIEYALAPFVRNAQPTLRQIMHHFSNAAEAYINFRNSKEPYMPRYGQVRNLRDMRYACIAFDFYEITSLTPPNVREVYYQMKAAALSGKSNRILGLDGNVGTSETDTERHVATDVNRNTHSFQGAHMI